MSDFFDPELEPPVPDGASVIRMADFDPGRPSRILTEMRAYWENLRNGRAVPARSDVEPKGMRRVLGHAFILERLAPGAARFRLAGRHLIDIMGMEVRGMPLSALFNPASRGRASDLLESVFSAPQSVEMEIESPSSYGRPPLKGGLLLLPLRSDLGDVTRALGCLVGDGQIGRAPRRFDLVSETLRPLLPGGSVQDPAAGRARDGFAEARGIWDSPAAQGGDGVDGLAGGDATTSPEQRRARFRVVVANPHPPKK
ncbi:PAS domain-containing protein [Paracoccus pacificus]|uniref:PAS domain-containing protein n=1 Tax=Paracoccus pacificus TaxID=1463598 RepID=A0ABW4R409_9RHOB